MPWVFSLEFFKSFLTNYLSHNKHRSIHRSPEVFYNFSVIFSKFLRIHFLEIKKKKKFSKQRRISFEKRWMIAKNVKAPHCVKSVRMRSYSGLHLRSISTYSARMRENAENMRTRITPNTDSFHAVPSWSETISGNWNRFKNNEKYLNDERYLNFCRLFSHVGKWLDKKTKVNFKIYDVITWEISNHNTHIAQ